MGAPLATKVTSDKFVFLTENSGYQIPNVILPKQLQNHGNYIISLSKLTRWLAEQAEQLGVEIYPGFAADTVTLSILSLRRLPVNIFILIRLHTACLYQVIYDVHNNVRGIVTKDSGIGKDGTQKDTFTPGVELRARQTIFAEGARGSCTESIIKKYGLRRGTDEPSYGLGLKEVWEVPENHPLFSPGTVQHTLGWPLQKSIWNTSEPFGGSFLYHMSPNQIHLGAYLCCCYTSLRPSILVSYVFVGLVVGLDYKNPYLNPYKVRKKISLLISMHLYYI